MAVIEISIGQFLPFIQPGTHTNPVGGQINDVISFTDAAKHSFHFIGIIQPFVISQSVFLDRSIYHQSILDAIGFFQSATHGPHEIVIQPLGFGQFAGVGPWELPKHTLVFHQTVVLIFGKGTRNTLVFGQIPICNVERHITIPQTLTLHSNGIGINPTERCIHYKTLNGPNSGGGA